MTFRICRSIQDLLSKAMFNLIDNAATYSAAEYDDRDHGEKE
jgi:hypothetical protein